MHFVLFAVISISFAVLVCYAVNGYILPHANRLIAERLGATLDERLHSLGDAQMKRMFDSRTGATRNVNASNVRIRTRDDDLNNSNIEGPLIPADCRASVRSCLRNEDCLVLCQRNATTLSYNCDQKTLLCRENGLTIDNSSSSDDGSGNNNNDDDNDTPINCRNDLGEYALLQGYNNLGVAEWNCVQIFPSWSEPGKRYCEGGVMHLDTRKGLPSYKQCDCPSGTTRIVYKRSIGQTVFDTGLPHCVKNPKLFEVDKDYVVYNN